MSAPLKQFQDQFKDLMLDHPDAVYTPRDVIVDALQAGDIPLPERLKVYRNNIVGSLTDVMRATFPTLEKLVGKDFFEGMARTFILQNPPRQGCLNTYGAGFDVFIKGFAPAAGLPYLVDVASLEIALNQAYYAPDDAALTAQDLTAIPPDNLADTVLHLRSSAHLLQSAYPLAAIQDFCARADEGDEAKLDLDQGGVRLMVYRPQFETQVILCDAPTFVFLQGVQAGQSLGEIVVDVLEDHPSFDVQAFLQTHIGLGTFAR